MVAFLVPVAVWILISGADDRFIAVLSLLRLRKPFDWPTNVQLEQVRQRPIAILVPLWREHRVIGQMLEHNLASIDYANYHVFVGVYPNDPQTLRAVTAAAARDSRIHLAMLPHDGPTSKGDCLNWIYCRLREFEACQQVRFEIVATHDAEDIIHPASLRLINWFSREYQMVQIPVLALPTSILEFTHGLYCDEFAEFQSKDIPVRQWLGGFMAGNGVGTGFERNALEALAASRGGRVFDPECLTEDYENGYRLFAMGCRQLFVPLRFDRTGPVATREYFPRRLRSAVRQRSRWVAGIALQGWRLHGWRVPIRQVYWFWRDRKGLVGNLLAPSANLLFLYGLCGRKLGASLPGWTAPLCIATLALSLFQTAIRIAASCRVYGARFAAFVPLRMLYGNLVNFLATAHALRRFFGARFRGSRLDWGKTEHVYLSHQRPDLGIARIGEVLVRIRAVSHEIVEHAAASQPSHLRLGEYLMFLQQISEENLYRALSVQSGIPLGSPKIEEVRRPATRSLPAETVRRWKVLPYRVEMGQLHLITTEPPTAEMTRALAFLSTLDLRFRLVRPHEYRRFASLYLPQASRPNAMLEGVAPSGR